MRRAQQGPAACSGCAWERQGGRRCPGAGRAAVPSLAACCFLRCPVSLLGSPPPCEASPSTLGCSLQGRHHGFRDPRGIALLGGEQWRWQSSGLHLRGAWHKSGRSHRDVASRVWGGRSGAGRGLLTEEGGWQHYGWTRGWHCTASSPGSGWGAEGEEREGEDEEAQGKGRW